MHPFESAGLGKAPFNCINVRENVWTSGCGTVHKAGGNCDFCGTSIRWEYVIKSSDDKKFVVGCDCVEKTHSEVIGFKEVKSQHEKQKRAVANAKAKEKRDAERAARDAEWKKEKDARRDERRINWNAANAELNNQFITYDGSNQFIMHLHANLNMWGSLTDRQCEVAINAFKEVEAAKIKVSNHIGNVGDKVKMKCKVVFCKYTSNALFYPFPAIYLVKLQTESGESLVWFTSKSHEVGKEFSSFTVKGHSEYLGMKETAVKLVK